MSVFDGWSICFWRGCVLLGRLVHLFLERVCPLTVGQFVSRGGGGGGGGGVGVL